MAKGFSDTSSVKNTHITVSIIQAPKVNKVILIGFINQSN